MADPGTAALRTGIERCGYYPQLVTDQVGVLLDGEPVLGHVVHLDTELDDHVGVLRHVTVLALTPSRLLVTHTDEHPAEDGAAARAVTTVEAVPLHRIARVGVTTAAAEPAAYRPGSPVSEVTVWAQWGAVRRVDVEPATCGDENCTADHGYTGEVADDDLQLRVSAAADGAEAVANALRFATALSRAVAGTR